MRTLRILVLSLLVAAFTTAKPRPAHAADTYKAMLIGGLIGAGVGVVVVLIMRAVRGSDAQATLAPHPLPRRAAFDLGPSPSAERVANAQAAWADVLGHFGPRANRCPCLLKELLHPVNIGAALLSNRFHVPASVGRVYSQSRRQVSESHHYSLELLSTGGLTSVGPLGAVSIQHFRLPKENGIERPNMTSINDMSQPHCSLGLIHETALPRTISPSAPPPPEEPLMITKRTANP
jgi:hypothetical protein